MKGVSFLKTMELLGLFPSKTFEQEMENHRLPWQQPALPQQGNLWAAQIQILLSSTAREAATLCGSSFSTASAAMPAASSSFRASAEVFPFIRASV